MALHLNQLLGVKQGIKSRSYTITTELFRKAQKAPLVSGIVRTYLPRDDDGDRLPSETTRVQINIEELLNEIADQVTPLLDVQFQVDEANTRAFADVTVDGQLIVADAPATYLLFLDKQLTDWKAILDKLPLLDPSEAWSQDPNENSGVYRTAPVQTVKTKKVPRNHVLQAATDKHPAQVQVYHEDVPVGDWTTVRFSGAVPAARLSELRERVEKLIIAVKQARELANETEVEDGHPGPRVFRYLISGTTTG